MPTKLAKHLPANSDGFIITINFENINEVCPQHNQNFENGGVAWVVACRIVRKNEGVGGKRYFKKGGREKKWEF